MEKPNIKVIVYSLIALGFVALTFLVDWMFIIGAIILIWHNQKELMILVLLWSMMIKIPVY